MELALHLRSLAQEEALGSFPQHLATFYGSIFPGNERLGENIARSFARIYLGDEFCPHRLPSLSDLKAFYQCAEKKGVGVTLLTPVFTNEGWKWYTPIFEYLYSKDPMAEVVVNDWGTICFLKERYPHLQLAAGRLFNKGFKDPRLSWPDKTASFSGETKALLHGSTFDFRTVQEKMMALGVTRLERDLLPYGTLRVDTASPLNQSIYFPFGYITTGRVCWIASFTQPAKQKFIPLHQCAQLCSMSVLELKSQDAAFPIIQSGNTIFYRYTPLMVASLFKTAKRKKVRLVYQGFAI